MNAVPTREELFEMAARPIGDADLYQRAKSVLPGEKPHPEVVEAAKRASKLWLPCGKKSAVNAEAKEVRAEFNARQIDLEDAVEAAGGARGSLTQ